MLKKKLLTDRSGDLADQIMAEKAKELANEMDREILWSMLESLGWKRVMINRFQDNNHAVDITYWLNENCQSAYERSGSDFIFESKKDAAWFALRWS